MYKINHFKVNKSVSLSAFIVCNHLLWKCLLPEHFHGPQNTPLAVTPCWLFPGAHNLLSASMYLLILSISYKWDHVILDLLNLALLCSIMFLAHCSTPLYSVPFYGCVLLHFVDIPHLFIQSSLIRYLGYSHLLDIVNSAAMNQCPF